jgi:LmbE family N-acetylglucosaminyl deacetylase
MKRPKIIISPHCDDALLALGGSIQIWQPNPITVLTLFGTCAWTVGESMTAEEITKINRQEEERALHLAGCESVCLEYDEVLLRGYRKWNESPKSHDNDLQASITKELPTYIPPSSDIYIPLAVGKHTDHLLTQRAALKLLQQWHEAKCTIFFYEDVPYSWYENTLHYVSKLPITVAPILTDISTVMEQKIIYLSIYKTQIGPDEIKKVNEYARSIESGRIMERVWQVKM